MNQETACCTLVAGGSWTGTTTAQSFPGERFKHDATVSAAAPEWYAMGGRVFLKMDGLAAAVVTATS